jgi:hypothetical protein
MTTRRMIIDYVDSNLRYRAGVRHFFRALYDAGLKAGGRSASPGEAVHFTRSATGGDR